MKSESSTLSGEVSYSDVSVVMPAYNEEASIAALIGRVRALSDEIEIIVVDDGSADRTAEVAEAAGAKVVRSPYTVGSGASVERGILASDRVFILMVDGYGHASTRRNPKVARGTWNV